MTRAAGSASAEEDKVGTRYPSQTLLGIAALFGAVVIEQKENALSTRYRQQSIMLIGYNSRIHSHSPF